MARYIDADALKQRIMNNWYTATEISDEIDAEPTADVVEKEWYDILLEHANILAEEMRKYQSAQPETRWIPVTERLPEKDGMYLVSISPQSRMEKRVDTDFYSHFGVWQIFGKFVTAWMLLPEPYRKETEDAVH